MREAHKIEQGKRSITVAVVDTPIDTTHPWLSDASLDGQDFSHGDYTLHSMSHGTHVSGLIRLMADITILPVAYYSEKATGKDNIRSSLSALRFAISQRVRVLNYSGGGPSFNEEELGILREAEEKGILIVAAAGNESQDVDKALNHFYPASYGPYLSNMITVSSVDQFGHLVESSNWGKTTIDVAAPGEGHFSALPGNRYGVMSGTSQATAIVSGVAALVISHYPELTPEQVKRAIMASVTPSDELKYKVISGGRVDARRALIAAQRFAKGRK